MTINQKILENKEKVTNLNQTENTQFVFLISHQTPHNRKKKINQNTPIQYLVVHVRKNSREVVDQIEGGGSRESSSSCCVGRREANRWRRRATNSLGNRWAEIIFENGGSLPAHYGRHVSFPPPLYSLSLFSISHPFSLIHRVFTFFHLNTPKIYYCTILFPPIYKDNKSLQKVKEMVIIIIT